MSRIRINADVVENDLVFSDVTTANSTSGQHGLLPKLSGSASDVLTGTGAWGTVAGGLLAFTTVNITTGTLASGAIEKGTISMAKASLLQKLTGNFPYRLRLYATAAQRDVDAGTQNGVGIDRNNLTLPLAGGDTGVICDLYLTSTLYSVAGPAITNISLTSNVVTVTCANTFSPGDSVQITKLVTATWLNGAILTVSTASSSQFTAAFSYANYTSAPDTGSASPLAYPLWKFTPPTIGINSDSPQASQLYYAITNLDSVSRAISLTITYLPWVT